MRSCTARAARRGAPFRLVATRANGQPAFGCYFPSPETGIAEPAGLVVLALSGDGLAELTWLTDTSTFALLGLPASVETF